MFCPNCGAQNDDAAMACAKCGHQLRAAAAPKFKGTMLMMNNPGVPRPGAAGPFPGAPGAPAAPPGPFGAPPGAPPGGVPGPYGAPPQGAPGGPPPGGVQPKPKLKGTMIGVAPPSLGSQAPVAAGMPPSVGPTHGMGAHPPPAEPPPPAPAAPPHAVNPLGGTMVADPGAYGGAMPGMPQGGFGGPPPGADPYAGPPPGADPYAGPPPAANVGMGGPPGFGGGAPPAPGFGIDQTLQQGQAPQMTGAQPLDAGGALAAHGGPPGAMSAMDDIPKGMVGGPNPVVTVLLIVFTCGIYGIYLLIKNKKGG